MKNNECEPGNKDVKVCVGDASGPGEFVGFFEDDGVVGCLYVSDRRSNKIVKQLQIYRDSAKLKVREADVEVVWSKDGTKCGVMIWGGMRGIIDLKKNLEGRILLDGRNTPAIDDLEWLRGFYPGYES
jgi:hypothetical protein